ncbi:MAG: SurA N-terminal domain-containing protein [Bacteroidales bacterium]|nr:SurA N-terminal domain-containing protein [Candidatus Colicola coprequi]
MATLQKIRNHGVILIVIVGLAMLAFILGDFLNSGSSFFNRSREYVGEIEGQKIHYTDYETAKENLTEVYKIESGRSDFDEETQSQIRNQVWNMMLMDYILRAQAEKIGMQVTTDELSELCIGQNPHQLIQQRRAFFDESGAFSRDNLVRFLASLEQETDNAEQAANLKQAKTYWLYWENAVRMTQMQDKYTSLLQSMVTANPIDAKYAFDAAQKSVTVQYALQPYYTIADSTLKVSANDVRKLYNERKPLYRQIPNRSIEYISFAVVPSEEDFAAAAEEMNAIYSEFCTTEDVAVVVNTNSDIMYDGRNYSETTIPEIWKEFAFGKQAKAGNCTDIIFDGETYRMARIMECGYSMPDSVELRVVVPEGEEEQPAQWYTETMLQKNISEPAFAGKRGDQFTVAMGLNEITLEITDIAKATPKAKVAIIERTVTPSSKTYSVIYNQAKQFIVNNATEEAYRAAAKEAGMTIYPAYNLNAIADKVASLKNSRPIVRWAFEAKEGQISDVFECGEEFIVALLTDVKDGDYMPIADVQNELKAEVMNRQKAAQIMATVGAPQTIAEAAEKMNTTAQTAESVTLGAYRFGNQGAEPAVIGKAMQMAQNGEQGVALVAGNAGVYAISVGTITASSVEFDQAQQIQQLNMRTMYSLPYQAITLLQQEAEITDNRKNFQ